MHLRRQTAGHAIDVRPTKSETPDTYPKGRRCGRCACYLNQYNEGPLCHPCQPGGEGVLIEVAPNHWRRFVLAEPERGEQILELMEAA